MTEFEKKTDKFKLRRRPRVQEADDFRQWLSTLAVTHKPSVHVNGPSHPTAVVVVDFGTPLTDPTKLTTDQTAELISQIRATTKALHRDRDVSVRVQSDSNTGIWWSSIG